MMRRREFIATGLAATHALTGSREAHAALPEKWYVPAEDRRHARTFMQWPVSRRVYSSRSFLDQTQNTVAEIANTIVAFEPVAMLAAKADHAGARKKLAANVELWDVPTEDLWCRDSGPIFAIGPDGKLAVSLIRFNGWGRKQVHRRDGEIAKSLAERLDLPLFDSGLLGEGGGVEHDGHGSLIAHESSWVNPNRNPGMNKKEIGTRLLAAYGAERIVWSKGVYGLDITDYHIDGLARFTGRNQILVNLPSTPDRFDPFHNAAVATRKALDGAGYSVSVIDEPNQRRVKDIDFVASYVNYYVCNRAVIAAEFGDPSTDAKAVSALRKHYPGREVIALNVDALGLLGGGIHCATQQMPSV